MGKKKVKVKRLNTISEAVMQAALQELIQGKLTLKDAAAIFGISKTTLHSRLKKVKSELSESEKVSLKMGLKNKEMANKFATRQIFTMAQEESLVAYLLTASKLNFGLSLQTTRDLAYMYAISIGQKLPESWEANKSAGKAWAICFLKRHREIQLRKPGVAPIASSSSFTQQSVEDLFKKLQDMMEKHHLEPSRIIASNCRACQDKTQEKAQIFIFTSSKLPDIFNEITSLDIHENDGLPKVLCSTCYDRLLEAYNFRKMCSAAALHFQQILSNDIPEEKYTPPENRSDIHFVDTSLIIKTEPDPEMEDSLCDISETLSIDEKIPETLKTEPDDDSMEEENALLISSAGNAYCLPDREDFFIEDKVQTDTDDQGEYISYECAICNTSFNRKSHLELHMRKEHLGLKSCKCKICGMVFETSDCLRSHINTHQVAKQRNVSENSSVECVKADECKSQKDIKKKGKEWPCELCPYKALQKGRLRHHVKVVHQGVKELHCPECKKAFTRVSVLQQHILRHEGVKKYLCSVCGVKKVTQTELKRHMMAIHKIEKIFSCKFCPFKSNLNGSLKQHVKQVHDEVKEYKCSHCSKTFSVARHLKNHEMIHTGERPHVCSNCPKSFITFDQLRIHMNIHTGENIFSCESCAFKTIHKTQLKRHVRVVHEGIKDYHCPHCDRAFSVSGALKDHIMTHTGEKPRACGECGRRFVQLSTLKKHMKVHLKPKP